MGYDLHQASMLHGEDGKTRFQYQPSIILLKPDVAACGQGNQGEAQRCGSVS